jgi:hypothetical protein
MKYFKLDQTVYHPVYGEGLVISTKHDFMDYKILVQFEKSSISFREDGSDYHTRAIVLSQNPIPEIVNKSLEDVYIPFTFKDDLIGKQIISKDNSCKGIITYQNKDNIKLSDVFHSYGYILDKYEFIDGKPCGKLGN